MCMMPQFGAIIASLQPGDEVIIRKNFGMPKTKEATKDIIANVHRCSALTAKGRKLICRDAIGIEMTGKHFTDFDISPEAKKILKKAGLS